VPLEATDEHLQILATLAGCFGQAEFRESIRQAPDADAMYKIAIAYMPQKGYAIGLILKSLRHAFKLL
jgi:hypothetical protein